MHELGRETRNVQNPALGAMLLWRFAVGYERNRTATPSPLPLMFLVLPIVLHEETAQLVTSTQEASGLRVFASKFSETRISKADLLLAINRRAFEMRKLTMDSLALATSSGLISFDCDRGTVVALSSSPAKSGIPLSIKPMLKAAERLGLWCSAVSIHEVSVILKVVF
ncbi:three component ABC system middle component [Dehalococcoides mccartyi]|uniref:Three component ABC system middle component n=1 Tax=Dehalococcoides mccartyi TaxID=61435 RepID=A0AB38Z835_9CHLR|nr:three component ABC system middle component [Dehalococcoides mccartyi]WRO06710.1 three component ABC system middle component [Dehalococcoides mccartyi]